jgi:hypothetical protein
MRKEKLELLFEYVKSELAEGYVISGHLNSWWDVGTEDSEWGCALIKPWPDNTIHVGAGYSSRIKFVLNVHDPKFGEKLRHAIKVGHDDKPGGWDFDHPLRKKKQ